MMHYAMPTSIDTTIADVAALNSLQVTYLTEAQLELHNQSVHEHFRAPVVTSLGEAVRPFSWLWLDSENRVVLVNRMTGSLYEPDGRGLNALPTAPVMVGGPWTEPQEVTVVVELDEALEGEDNE